MLIPPVVFRRRGCLAGLILLASSVVTAQERFVRIEGGAMPGRAGVAIDEFEISDTPVTNAQYLAFVKEARHRAPAHWRNGAPPAGFDNHPVVFVNRYDAEDYVAWRTKKEGRIHRLPTSMEFEYAARAGDGGAQYPWGNADPEGRANYDADGKRSFPEWEKWLKPVRSYEPNKWKLYDMAGNVWQMVTTDPDPAQRRWIFRLEEAKQKESTVAGGSWARSAGYLKVGVRGGAGGAGITHPDLGFRVVRESAGTTHFHRQVRRLTALPLAGGGMAVAWQMLASDSGGTGYHVYRSPRRDASGVRMTQQPVKEVTR